MVTGEGESARGSRERDLVLGPHEYAMILDETKGNVSVFVGPHKTSLSNTDRPVLFEERTGNFKRCTLEEAITVFPTADEGSYLILTNPVDSDEEEEKHPNANASSSAAKLLVGRKINIPGPVTFPLWPGQIARVVDGHRLRSNHYLLVRVYNDESAKEHWERAIVKPQTSEESETRESKQKVKAEEKIEKAGLTMGQLLVIKGTEVSFYIPPTGLEVVRDDQKYIRDAVTLERLEYCILLDEDGNKRFVQGPDVVFPRPTETFVEGLNGSKKFRAIELNENMGLYVKVIEEYMEEGVVGDEAEDEVEEEVEEEAVAGKGKKRGRRKRRKAGDELFITGKEQKIYFPRQEHAIVKYGEDDMHFAIAIPEGEARYVLNKVTGEIKLVKGPQMFLPDPRKEVVVRRILDQRSADLWFPGNREALEHNRRLEEAAKSISEGDFLTEDEFGGRKRSRKHLIAAAALAPGGAEEFERKRQFTPPRTITLDTKYDGAVSIGVWTGYAIQVVSKSGERKVIRGPQTILLEYDETLDILTMSTGTPKSDDDLIKTVYLLVQNNKVSDLVEAETKDLVKVKTIVSYRVNFEGDGSKWFNVENYVKLLTEHLRSMIRNAVKQHGVEDFNDNAINIIRDTVLGTQGEEGKRPGRVFDENGMVVYDLEVLDVIIGDNKISEMLTAAQHNSVKQAIDLVTLERDRDATERTEKINQEIATLRSATVLNDLTIDIEEVKKKQEAETEGIVKEFAASDLRYEKEKGQQTVVDELQKSRLVREREEADQAHALEEKSHDLLEKRTQIETSGIKDRAEAVSPELMVVLKDYADKDLLAKLSANMSPLAILGGKSVIEVIRNLVKGSVFEDVLNKRLLTSKDGDEVEEAEVKQE